MGCGPADLLEAEIVKRTADAAAPYMPRNIMPTQPQTKGTKIDRLPPRPFQHVSFVRCTFGSAALFIPVPLSDFLVMGKKLKMTHWYSMQALQCAWNGVEPVELHEQLEHGIHRG